MTEEDSRRLWKWVAKLEKNPGAMHLYEFRDIKNTRTIVSARPTGQYNGPGQWLACRGPLALRRRGYIAPTLTEAVFAALAGSLIDDTKE